MQIKGKIENGGEKRLKVLRIITVIGLLFATCFIGTAAAEEEEVFAPAESPEETYSDELIQEIQQNVVTEGWNGWTCRDSPYERLNPEWIQDVKEHAAVYIYDSSKDFEWRAQAQAYVLGWDDRITYVDEHGIIDEGHTDEETGEWVEGTGAITYDWGFFGNTFGWGVPENLFQNKSEYDAALTIYYENYDAAVQPVPREV